MATADPQLLPEEASYSPSGSPPATAFLVNAIRKRWWLFFICMIVSGGLAYGTAKLMKKTTATATGSILYAGLPSSPSRIGYMSPTIDTYIVMVASPTNLNRLRDIHDIELGVPQLARCLTVKTGRFRSAKIDITFIWNDEEEAVEWLDDLMEIFIEEVIRLRSETLDTHIRHGDRMLLVATAKADQAAERLRTQQQREGSAATNLALMEQELQALSSSIETIKTSLDTAEFTKVGLQTEIDAISQRNTDLQKTYKARLFGDVNDRYTEVRRQYGPKSSALIRLKEVGRRLDEMAEKIDNDHDVVEWKTQLLAINRMILPTVVDDEEMLDELLQPYEQEIDRIETQRRDLVLRLHVNDQQIELLKARLKNKAVELREMKASVPAASEYALRLEAEYEEANRERQLIKEQVSGLQQLKGTRAREFSVATAPYIREVETNTRKMFVVVFIFVAALLSAPIFAWEYFAERNTLEHTGRRLGLPVLSTQALVPQMADRRYAHLDCPDSDALRLLALRIQQSVSQPGSTVLVSGLDYQGSTFPLLCGLAQCLADRGEHVLIVDAGKSVIASEEHLKNLLGEPLQDFAASRRSERVMVASSGGESDAQEDSPSEVQGGALTTSSMKPIGLSDYLELEDVHVEDVILPTTLAGVDCICSGSRSFPVEGLASRRMSDVLDHARKNYSLVLVAGPPSDQLADLQMLAARADGILFTAVPGKSLAERSREILQELVDLDAPILGIVS